MRTLSRQLSVAKSRGFWNVRATPRAAITFVGRPWMGFPSRRMDPLAGRYTPVIALKTVVFPAPFGPMSPPSVPRGSW